MQYASRYCIPGSEEKQLAAVLAEAAPGLTNADDSKPICLPQDTLMVIIIIIII